VNIDNHFKGIGLHGVYDSVYDRVIITKLDYAPKSNNILYDPVEQDFYINNIVNELVIRQNVSLNDERYFCNVSWTLSFNMNTKSWISFHSYIPNFYVAENSFFYSGQNDCCEDFDFLVGVLIPNPTTTTTTSTSTSSTSTTSTTTTTVAPLQCNITATVAQIDCSLAGVGVIVSLDCDLAGDGYVGPPTTSTTTSTTSTSTTSTTSTSTSTTSSTTTTTTTATPTTTTTTTIEPTTTTTTTTLEPTTTTTTTTLEPTTTTTTTTIEPTTTTTTTTTLEPTTTTTTTTLEPTTTTTTTTIAPPYSGPCGKYTLFDEGDPAGSTFEYYDFPSGTLISVNVPFGSPGVVVQAYTIPGVILISGDGTSTGPTACT
jgi:hypothetical protein